MAKPPLPVDWDVVKSLYLQGVPVPTLSERFGINTSTLRARACKKGWNAALGTERERKKQITERSTAIARDIWAERRETMRERIHLIGDRMTNAAAQLPEDQLLNKADKIKIATEIAGKIVGLDKQEDRNTLNLAILGDLGGGNVSRDVPIFTVNRDGDTDCQPVIALNDSDEDALQLADPTTHPTTVDPGPGRALHDR